MMKRSSIIGMHMRARWRFLLVASALLVLLLIFSGCHSGEFTEEPEGGISYLIKMSGRGLDTLNENCFNGDAQISKDDDDHIHISWNADSMLYSLRVVSR